MPIYNIGNPQRTSTAKQQDDMLTSRNMTTKSNTYLEKPTYQQTHCHNHPERTRAKMITKMS